MFQRESLPNSGPATGRISRSGVPREESPPPLSDSHPQRPSSEPCAPQPFVCPLRRMVCPRPNLRSGLRRISWATPPCWLRAHLSDPPDRQEARQRGFLEQSKEEHVNVFGSLCGGGRSGSFGKSVENALPRREFVVTRASLRGLRLKLVLPTSRAETDLAVTLPSLPVPEKSKQKLISGRFPRCETSPTCTNI